MGSCKVLYGGQENMLLILVLWLQLLTLYIHQGVCTKPMLSQVSDLHHSLMALLTSSAPSSNKCLVLLLLSCLILTGHKLMPKIN